MSYDIAYVHKMATYVPFITDSTIMLLTQYKTHVNVGTRVQF